ncbi:hypothetical protein PG984_009264 [Apiospora sp. TS-2023a]
MQFIFALVFFLFGLCANAVTFNDILSSLPNGGYMADMEVYQTGLLNVTDLNGNMVKGSPFIIDPVPAHGVASHDTNPNITRSTSDQWGCIGGGLIDEGFWSDAGNQLGRWCDHGHKVSGWGIWWWQTDEDLAYICNYAGPQNCGWDEYFDYMKKIAENCGYLSSGWFLQGSGDKTYGRGIKGDSLSDPLNVCSNMGG